VPANENWGPETNTKYSTRSRSFKSSCQPMKTEGLKRTPNIALGVEVSKDIWNYIEHIVQLSLNSLLLRQEPPPINGQCISYRQTPAIDKDWEASRIGFRLLTAWKCKRTILIVRAKIKDSHRKSKKSNQNQSQHCKRAKRYTESIPGTVTIIIPLKRQKHKQSFGDKKP
jgi:hypothetical protein